jgi:hypothetical protein
METVRGTNNLLLTCRFSATGVTIARLKTADAVVTLPETLRGLPVTALGDHALTPDSREAEGEQIRVTTGAETGALPERRPLTVLTLPQTLEQVGDYAFYNCTTLRSLTLWDSVKNWGGSALMNCGGLHRLSIRLREWQNHALYYFADELPWELDVTLTYPDGGQARLIFPEYLEHYEENAPAHHFDYILDGAGYPYHHCFQNRRFSLPAFDALWEDFLRTEHSDVCAMLLAWHRLQTPRELGGNAAAQYRAYLREHCGAVLNWLLSERNLHGLHWFLQWAELSRELLDNACALAREQGMAAEQALLLETLHRRYPAGAAKTFDL